MEAYGETMRFVANLLNQVQDGRMAIQNAWFIFLAEDIENLFFFRDAGDRLVDDLQQFQSLRRSMQLPDAASIKSG